MIIHLLEADKLPEKGDNVEVNCGKIVRFSVPMAVLFGDGRICPDCLNVHRVVRLKGKTFAIKED